jgi:hypothetical protein
MLKNYLVYFIVFGEQLPQYFGFVFVVDTNIEL